MNDPEKQRQASARELLNDSVPQSPDDSVNS